MRHHWIAQFKKIQDKKIQESIQEKAQNECVKMPNGDPLKMHYDELIATYTAQHFGEEYE